MVKLFNIYFRKLLLKCFYKNTKTLLEKKYIFRFSIEHINGLEPAAKSHIKNQQSTIEIPEGLYDTGDGFYQPLTNTVHNYWTNELIRSLEKVKTNNNINNIISFSIILKNIKLSLPIFHVK